MIKINPIASGSTGNAYHIDDGHCPLLIECGISLDKIRRALNYKTSSLAGCLISHEHGDHSKSAKALLQAGVDCYMTKGTAEGLNLKRHYRTKILPMADTVKIDSWACYVFHTYHDSKQPCGFYLQSKDKEHLLYVSDTHFIMERFRPLEYIMIECNYSESILKRSNTPDFLKERIMTNHLSLENVVEFLASNDLSKTKEIWLLHLSSGHSDEKKFVRQIERIFGIPVYVA